MIKFQQSQALTSHFENFWSIVLHWFFLKTNKIQRLLQKSAHIANICVIRSYITATGSSHSSVQNGGVSVSACIHFPGKCVIYANVLEKFAYFWRHGGLVLHQVFGFVDQHGVGVPHAHAHTGHNVE